MNNNPFIAAARAGRNDFGRYVITVLMTLFFLFSGTMVVVVALMLIGIDPRAQLSGSAALVYFAINLLLFAVVWLALALALPFLHNRPFITLINPARRFNWGRFGLGAGLWLALNIAYNLVFAVLKPGYYTWSLDLPAFLPYLLVSLLLIPVQSGAEELFFRGYLTQGLGQINIWLGWLLPSVAFGLLHGANSEVSAYGALMTLPVYIGMGLLLGWITLRSGSLELALGVHILNNLYSFLITSLPAASLQSESIFRIENVDPTAEMVAAFAISLAFVLILEAILRRKPGGGQPGAPVVLSVLLCAGLLLGLAACSPAAALPAGPTITLGACEQTGALRGNDDARCGTLSVPENRANPDGRKITLNVVVIESVSRSPEPDPLFLLAGGPGEAAVDTFTPLLYRLEPVRQKRDLVLVDQRGTGKSGALTCQPAAATPAPGLTPTPIGQEQPRGDMLAEVQDCLASMPEADLTQYTTEIAMQDLDAVRAALGYEQINLLGVSYGTRAALTYARLFPDRVRSMILDGVVPPGWALGSSMRADAQQALDFIFERCAASEACRETFPDFENDFYDVLERAQQQAIEVEAVHPTSGQKVRVAITPLVVTATVRLMSYNDSQVALLPLMLNQAYQGDYTLLASQYLLMLNSLGGINSGLYYSVWCYEDLPKLSPEGELGSFYFDPDMGLSRDICSLWPKTGQGQPQGSPSATPSGSSSAFGVPAAGLGASFGFAPGAGGLPQAAATGYPPTAAVTDTPYPAPGGSSLTPYPEPGQATPTTGGAPVQPTTTGSAPTAEAPAGSSTANPQATAGPDDSGPQPTPDIDWERSFPRTDIPVMIISGEFDPVTPPRNGDEVAALFTNSVHIILPGMGHANFYGGCLPTLLRDFVNAGSPLALNLDCVRTIQPLPFFLSPVGPVPSR